MAQHLSVPPSQHPPLRHLQAVPEQSPMVLLADPPRLVEQEEQEREPELELERKVPLDGSQLPDSAWPAVHGAHSP